MELHADAIPWESMYKLMIGAIVPRPIGWISTVDADGNANLAPYSFFNAVCSNPPHVLFCASVRAKPKEGSDHKDTLNNVRATGEFVVNIVTAPLAEAMNQSSGDYPRGVSEFAMAGVTPAPSAVVRPPRVLESPIHFECAVSQIIEVSPLPGGATIVLGRVLHVHVDDALLIGTDKIDTLRLAPIGRLAGASYTHVDDVFDLARPKV
jgi:flavin reductase (DIM6/NTAB) family NADH-FMN oxidoreductase RutF